MNKRIFNIIKQYSPIKRDNLLFILQSTYPKLTDRTMRNHIRQLVLSGVLIQSSKNGYNAIVKYSQMLECYNLFKKNAKADAIRANAMIASWNEQHQGVPKNRQFKVF